MTSERVLRTGVVLAVLLAAFAMTATARAGAPDAEAAVAAVWQPRTLTFEFRAGNTIYMCRSLQRKIERILLQVGVRERVQFRRFYCGDLSHVVSAEIALLAPLEATTQNIQRLTDYDSREILVARVRAQRLPAAADLQVFPAAWQTVSISGMNLGRDDCELLQQLHRQVLSKLAVRTVDDNLELCATVFARGVAPRLVVRALIAQSVDRLAERQ